MRATFDINYFGGLALIQGFVKKWVRANQRGKIVLTGSVAGLIVGPGVGAYAATKFAIEFMAWALRLELARHNIKVQVINPGPYFTGFNETHVEEAYRWLGNPDNFTTPEEYREMTAWIEKLDPQECVDEMIRIIPSDEGKYRNLIPARMAPEIRKTADSAWDWTIQDA